MKLTLLIGVAVLAAACGGHGNDQSQPSGAGTAARPANGDATGPASGTTGSSDQANTTVTLIGCLEGPSLPEPTGTGGDRNRARTTGTDAIAPDANGGATAARYMLRNASPASANSGGVGANGAGASGGPLVSGTQSYELDALPPAAQASVNKQVRVVARVDPRPAGAGSLMESGAGDATAANSGTRGAGVGTPSSMGTVGAAGSTNAGGTTAANGSGSGSSASRTTGSGTSGSGVSGSGADAGVANGASAGAGQINRRLTVQSVEVVAQNCTQR